MGAASFSPKLLEHHFHWRSAWVVKQFWCCYPLKGPNDVFLVLGWRPEFVKPWTTNMQKARDECILFVFSLLNSAVSISAFLSACNQMTAMNWKGHGRMWFDIMKVLTRQRDTMKTWARRVIFLTEVWTTQLLKTSQKCCHCSQENTFFFYQCLFLCSC